MKSIIKKIIAKILEIECRIILKKYRPFIITVTGSVGKTSTKDAIFTVLSSVKSVAGGASVSGKTSIRRSDKSFNSELGVPLTILGCDNPWGNFIGWLGVMSHGIELIVFKSDFPSTLVLEIGADHPGDIHRLARWMRPDISVVTKIGKVPVHIEFFPSREALVAEKLSIARKVKSTGTLILPSDDPEILAIRKDNPIKALSYGINAPADVSANFIETTYDTATGMPSGIAFKLNYLGNSIPVRIPGVLGIQHVYPLVAATAVGLSRGMTITAIIDSFGEHIPPRGRMNILNGLSGSAIIDDTYNASPDAVAEALGVLRSLKITPGSRKIAVLGDMMELGKFSQDEHKKVGVLVADILKDPQDVLVTVGQRAKSIRESAVAAGMPESAVLSFDTSREAGPVIAAMVKKGEIILVKGSQSPRLERISEALLQDPSQAGSLLVRQDAEWKNR
ncbi:MAG: hypothetical protein RIT04_306 [Candidatus Parcubacteria bacterium]|jgi:UDP-N-acetylmuramyl pentapeptide synthase